MHQEVVGSVPDQGTFLEGCGFNPQWACVGGNQVMFLSHINISFSLKKQIDKNMSSGED